MGPLVTKAHSESALKKILAVFSKFPDMCKYNIDFLYKK